MAPHGVGPCRRCVVREDSWSRDLRVGDEVTVDGGGTTDAAWTRNDG